MGFFPNTSSGGGGTPSGSAGGDLGSTYPNPTVISVSNVTTGTLGVTNGGTGTATAFTQGSVPFAGVSGVYAQDNSNIFWDNTNKRLGIGTASPSTDLHIKDDGVSFNLQRETSGHSEGWQISNDANAPVWFVGDFLYAANSDFSIYSYNGNIAALTISPAGKVGINTNTVSASEVLEVVGNIKASGFVDLSGIAAGSTNFKITATNATPSTTYTAHVASTDPAGFIQISVGGNARYLPFYT